MTPSFKKSTVITTATQGVFPVEQGDRFNELSNHKTTVTKNTKSGT